MKLIRECGTSWLLIVVVFLCVFGVMRLAHAEDAQDVRGTRHGCADATATGAFVTFTSASLEDQEGSVALPSGLYWTEVMVKSGSGTVYVCEAATASCGTDTTNKISVASGATLVLPLRGLATLSIAIRGVAGITYQICGYFRVGG